MNRQEARICLDGAEAFLMHTPMKIKDLTKIENAYHILRNAINGLPEDEISTEWEKSYKITRREEEE